MGKMNGSEKANALSLSALRRRKEIIMNKTITLSWTADQGKKSIHFDFGYDALKRIIEVEIIFCGERELKYKSSYSQNSDEWLESIENVQKTQMDIISAEMKSLKQLPVYDEIDPIIKQVTDTLTEALEVASTDELPWMLPEEYLQNDIIPDDEMEEVIHDDEVDLSTSEIGEMRIYLGEGMVLDLFLKDKESGYLLEGYLNIPYSELRIYCFYRALEMNYHQILTPWKQDMIRHGIEDEMIGKCLADVFLQDVDVIRKATQSISGFLSANAPVVVQSDEFVI
jgi:hypothetical protein